MTAPLAATINGVGIVDTFAEAFPMRATRLVITADSAKWARVAAASMTGFATSVIACGCEAAIEGDVEATPDGRPGVAVLIFAMGTKDLQKQLANRVGQCVLTSPGSACYAGLESGEEDLKLGAMLRYFGDGNQIAKKLDGRRWWRIPVMDGEFVIDDVTPMTKRAVGGGNLLVVGRSRAGVLAATEAAADAVAATPGAIAPFPGGIVRSGSKVGSKYKALPASTNETWCPTLRGVVDSELAPDEACVLEIVIDGLTFDAAADAMRAGIAAICAVGPEHGVTRIAAGNYGGKLGPHHFHLRDLTPGAAT